MASDPKPQHAVRSIDTDGAVMQANTHGPISADLFEAKRRMPWIVLKKRKSSVGELPYGRTQSRVTGPEGRRGAVGQSFVDRPAV